MRGTQQNETPSCSCICAPAIYLSISLLSSLSLSPPECQPPATTLPPLPRTFARESLLRRLMQCCPPDCRRAGIRFAAADRSTDTLPPTPLPTPWVPSAHPPLAYVQETEEHRDTRHTWTAQTPPVRVTSSSVLGGGATPSIAPRSLVFRTMCWRACLVLSCLDNLMLAGLRTTAPPTWLTLPKLPECGRVAARHAAAGNYTDTLAPIPLPHR